MSNGITESLSPRSIAAKLALDGTPAFYLGAVIGMHPSRLSNILRGHVQVDASVLAKLEAAVPAATRLYKAARHRRLR